MLDLYIYLTWVTSRLIRKKCFLFLSSRIAVPLVTRSILEVVIPELAVPKLITRSKNKLAQISEVTVPPVFLLLNLYLLFNIISSPMLIFVYHDDIIFFFVFFNFFIST